MADAQPSISGATSSMRQRCFTEHTPEASISYQIIDLGRQLYVWVSVGGAKMDNMYMAIQASTAQVPAVATLLPAPASTDCQSIAQRLAMKTNRPVLCSWNIPGSSPMLQVIAERRLLQELKDMLGLRTAPASVAPSMASAAEPTEAGCEESVRSSLATVNISSS